MWGARGTSLLSEQRDELAQPRQEGVQLFVSWAFPRHSLCLSGPWHRGVLPASHWGHL